MPMFADRSTSPPRYSHAPQALSLTLADLVAADGHRVSAAISVVVRLLDRPADIAVFNEQVAADKHSVALDDVRQYIAAQLRHSADDFVAERSGEACTDDEPAMQAFLFARLNEIGFGCGLEFLAPVTVRVSSATLAADRAAAAAARRQTAALDRAAELHQRLHAGGAAHLSASDQAELLPTLLHATAASAATLWLAAGPNVIAIDLPGRTARAINVDGIGALRSVRPIGVAGRTVLAVGGQRGVALIDPTGRTPSRIFALDTAGSPRGFNAVVVDEDARDIIATHGDIGLVRWSVDAPATPAITPLPGARLLTKLDDRLLLAAAGEVYVAVDGAIRALASDASPVIALAAFDDAVVVARADGHLSRRDRTMLGEISTLRRPGNLRCAAPLQVAGLQAVLLGTEAGVMDCLALGGHVLMQHRPRAGVSLIAAAGGTIAALSADRSTIEFIDPSAASSAAETINLVARLGHRATDLV